MGAVSDVKGKRKPFMIYGFILFAITTAIFPFAAIVKPIIMAVFIAILFDSIMSFFGTTAYDAAFIAYTTDVTTLDNRGKAVGIIEITTLLSTLIIYGGSGFIIIAYGYYLFFILVGIVVGIIAIIGSLLVEESETLIPLDISIKKHLKSTFSKDAIKQNKDYFLVLIGLAIWSIGFNVYFPFILIYLQHHIGLSLMLASLFVFFALVVSIVLCIPIGMLIDKVGRKVIVILSIIFEFISLILFAIAGDFIFLIITGIFWVLFMTLFHISSQTWIKDLYPEEKYGQFSGYYHLFYVLIGMTVGPLIGGIISTQYGKSIVIDGVPGNIPPPLIFIVAAFIILVAIIPILPAKDLKKVKRE
jgi:MFS family permease